MAGLEKLTVAAYENEDFSGPGSKKVEVLINPEKYSRTYKNFYSDIKAPGSPGGSSKFNRVASEKLTFELVFDATGIVGSKIPGVQIGKTLDVDLQIAEFKAIATVYNSKLSSPNYLLLSWGSLIFRCRLCSLDVNYTMFRPNGNPLRAKATAVFVSFDSERALALMAKKKSPDLTQTVTIKEGDTLPQLSFNVYGDASYFMQVAEKNNLTDFRNLKADTVLIFPPIKK
jgi:hypothetical protein